MLEAEKASLTDNPLGVNAYIMRKLGYTTLVETETAIKKEIDWSRPVIVLSGNNIWVEITAIDSLNREIDIVWQLHVNSQRASFSSSSLLGRVTMSILVIFLSMHITPYN